MKHLILCFVMFFVSSCYSEPALTGYRYGGGTDNGKIETCNEQEIVNKWLRHFSFLFSYVLDKNEKETWFNIIQRGQGRKKQWNMRKLIFLQKKIIQ